MNRILVSIILLTRISLLIFAPSLANAQIKVTPPANWHPLPNNNSTAMVWIQNSTKSGFGIGKPNLNNLNTKSPFMPLIGGLMGPILAKALDIKGWLESADSISFDNTDNAYRIILKPSSLSSTPFVNSSLLSNMPKELQGVPYKMMLILSQKQGDFYVIVFFSPSESFDSVLNELKPTIDSIELGNSTATTTNQTLLE